MLRQDMPLTELIDLFKNEPMQFEPGERWRYNNSGYILLGRSSRRSSGKTYADFVQERIFTPLGMADTRYNVTEQVIPRRAAGYAKSRRPHRQRPVPEHDPAVRRRLPSSAPSTTWRSGTPALTPDASSMRSRWRSVSRHTHWQAETRAATGMAGDRPLRGPGGPGARGRHPRVPLVCRPGPGRRRVRRRAVEYRRRDARSRHAGAQGRSHRHRQAAREPAPVALAPEQLDAYVGRYVAAGGHALRRHAGRARGCSCRPAMARRRRSSRRGTTSSSSGTISDASRFNATPPARSRAPRDRRLGPAAGRTRDTTPEKAAHRGDNSTRPHSKTYVGEYELAPGFVLAVTLEGDSS